MSFPWYPTGHRSQSYLGQEYMSNEGQESLEAILQVNYHKRLYKR